MRPSASVFNTSHGTWRILMHEKPCLIPIFIHSVAANDSDLGVCCPHMPEDTFLHGADHVINTMFYAFVELVRR